MQQPSNQMPRDKTQLTDYQKEILALEPKREDYPLASDEAWEEIRAGFRNRIAHILRPRARRSLDSPENRPR